MRRSLLGRFASISLYIWRVKFVLQHHAKRNTFVNIRYDVPEPILNCSSKVLRGRNQHSERGKSKRPNQSLLFNFGLRKYTHISACFSPLPAYPTSGTSRMLCGASKTSWNANLATHSIRELRLVLKRPLPGAPAADASKPWAIQRHFYRP